MRALEPEMTPEQEDRWNALETLLWIVNHHNRSSRRRRRKRVSPPADIAAIRGLAHLPMEPTCSGVYFLCHGKRVVYIGQSRNIPLRVYAHRDKQPIYGKPKTFDQVFYIPVRKDRLHETEAALIRAFRPRDNGTIPVLDDADTWRVLRRLAETET